MLLLRLHCDQAMTNSVKNKSSPLVADGTAAAAAQPLFGTVLDRGVLGGHSDGADVERYRLAHAQPHAEGEADDHGQESALQKYE